tara:strand:- start:332 stop:1138 length:807 start_codon:yes stop_codon:yes gene_type:complete
MFGKNEIVGKKFFPDEDHLLVTSYFATMQGEGPFSGRRAVFLRLAKCNLACSFCDTYFDSGDWFDLDELSTRLNGLVDDTRGWGLVVTGGEPLLQKALTRFLEREAGNWRWMQVESNGIIEREIPHGTTLVISPKCVEKNGVPTKYTKPHPTNLERVDALKFVMESIEVSPYSEVPQWAIELGHEMALPIFVSPMNVYNYEPKRAKTSRNSNRTTIEERSTVEEVISFWEPGLLNLEANERNHRYAAEYAIKHGLRFQVQAHLYAGLA